MPTYTAHYCTDAEHAFSNVEADTPEQALRLARELWERDPDALTFEPYTSMMPLTDITIDGPDGGGLAGWQSDDLRVQLAARALLDAAVLARRELRQLYATDSDSEALRVLSLAIAQATGTEENAV